MTYPTISPSLTLDFAKSEQLDPRINFTRDTTATYLGSDGLIKTAPENVARFEYDQNGKSLGLLIENAKANYVHNSRLGNAVSNSASFTVTTDTTIPSPEGDLTGVLKVDKTSTSNTGYFRRGQTRNLAAGVTYTFSVFFKNESLPDPFNKAGNNIGLIANTQSPNFEQLSESLRTTAELYKNGWYRQRFTFTPSYNQSYSISFNVNSTDTNTGVFYLWGFQAEANPSPSSYIPTLPGQEGQRGADIVDMPTAGIYGDDFTTINKDFGTVGGSDTLTFVGPNAERTVVYPDHLTQAQINEVATSDDDGFWRWRVFGTSFALPDFTTNGQVTVDWGDGTVEVLTTAEHTFTNGLGYHEIGFRLDSGTFFNTRILNNSTHKSKVRSVGPAPSSMSANLEHGFYGCDKLKVYDATTSVTSNLANAFLNCSSLLSFPFTDTSSVTNWQSTWSGCSSLTSFPLIDTSSGGSFYATWQNCSSLTSFPLIDTSTKSSFQLVWNGCSGLTSFPLLDTSSVTNFSFAWRNCSSLTSFPLIDASSGTNFTQTWNGCSGLTSFPLIDTSSGTSFNTAWASCTSLTSFPLIDTSSGTDFRYAWNGCSSLTSFPLIDTSNSTGSFTDTWNGCSSLTSFPAIVCNGSTYNEAWRDCTNLANFPANMFDSTSITVGKGHGQSWNGAWRNCALTAQSIENILVSLDTNGAQNCQLGIQGGTNAGQSTWSSAATTAYNNLITKGWTISANS